MAFTLKLLLTAVIFLISCARCGQAVSVQFYREKEYQDLLEQKVLTGDKELKCINLDSGVINIKSVTTDKCLIAYIYPNCKSGFSQTPAIFRIDGNTPSFGDFVGRSVGSFAVCSQKNGGGPQLDMDISKGTWSDKSTVEPESYRGVCGCRKVPSRLAGGKSFPIQIDNHGNSVNLYEEEDCKGWGMYMGAGVTQQTQTGYYGIDIKSFEPAELKDCYGLVARINKFEFKNGTASIDDLATEKIQLAKSSLKNIMSFVLTPAFRVNSNVAETLKFNVAGGLTKMESTEVESTAEITYENGVPGVSNVDVRTKLVADYKWSQTSGSEPNSTITVSGKKAVKIEREIKIPPCKECKITTFLKKVKDFQINYKAYSKVSAPGGAPMSANELRKHLPSGMEYVKDIDQYTIEAATQGVMYVEFGVEVIIDVDCDRQNIPKCVPGPYAPEDDHQVYVIPIRSVGQNLTENAPGSSKFVSFFKNAFDAFLNVLK